MTALVPRWGSEERRVVDSVGRQRGVEVIRVSVEKILSPYCRYRVRVLGCKQQSLADPVTLRCSDEHGSRSRLVQRGEILQKKRGNSTRVQVPFVGDPGDQHQIDCLKKKLASTLEVNKALSNEVRNREMRVQSNAKTAHEERAALIGHINKMVEKHKPQKAKSTSNLGCVPVKLPPIKKPHPPTEQQQHFLSSELRRLSS
ncbi:uncharacterized protein LOC121898200 [Thunnus maccoyii]|uniref:uncharacterized protein LOC121898200 n=1 Tax=Thunnus maccoyii TaxID=8240 RepID=UPI001C4B3857|nr:uncharacterized protein LOC121898200 [Thunnus maccoyii]